MLRLRLLMKNVDRNADRNVDWTAYLDAVWWFDEITRGLHPTLRRLNALTSLRCQKCCTWRWDCQMHWRICGARNAAPNIETIRCTDGFSNLSEKLHPTLKRLNALTGFRICQKNCTQHWGGWMHWRVDGFFLTQARRGVKNLLLAAKYVGWDLQNKNWLLKWRKQTDR